MAFNKAQTSILMCHPTMVSKEFQEETIFNFYSIILQKSSVKQKNKKTSRCYNQ